jgi:GNAT superfamily N-acetyltransferase
MMMFDVGVIPKGTDLGGLVPKELWQLTDRPDYTVLGAVDGDGAIAGVLVVSVELTGAHIIHLFVHEAFRLRGAATALIGFFAGKLPVPKPDYPISCLFTDHDSTRTFFEHIGFSTDFAEGAVFSALLGDLAAKLPQQNAVHILPYFELPLYIRRAFLHQTDTPPFDEHGLHPASRVILDGDKISAVCCLSRSGKDLFLKYVRLKTGNTKENFAMLADTCAAAVAEFGAETKVITYAVNTASFNLAKRFFGSEQARLVRASCISTDFTLRQDIKKSAEELIGAYHV